jgi:hypothetical protein
MNGNGAQQKETFFSRLPSFPGRKNRAVETSVYHLPGGNISQPGATRPAQNRNGFFDRRKQALKNSLYHLPAVFLTFGILSLSFARLFWESPKKNTNTILGSLQFVAQIHTGLVIMSVSSMLLQYVHMQVNGAHGVPLGFLSSNFQLTSIRYPFSAEFRGLGPRYILLFLAAFLLVVLSGPSSALIMLPRLQYWSIPQMMELRNDFESRVYIRGNERQIYPHIIDSDWAYTDCNETDASNRYWCPSYNIR